MTSFLRIAVFFLKIATRGERLTDPQRGVEPGGKALKCASLKIRFRVIPLPIFTEAIFKPFESQLQAYSKPIASLFQFHSKVSMHQKDKTLFQIIFSNSIFNFFNTCDLLIK